MYNNKVNIGLIGIGYWGPNLLRVFNSLNGVRIKYVCDENEKKLKKIKKKYPLIKFTNDFNQILKDKKVTALAISTPASTHYRLVKRALKNGKDVFIEKPLALKIGDAEELVRLSDKNKKILMVGHLLEYHPVIVTLKDMIKRGRLGEIYYIDSRRLNLGKIRRDENVLWSLAVHDIAAIMYLLGKMPQSVEVIGSSYIQTKVEDLAFIMLYFPSNILTHIHTSWLHHKKVREITVVGSKKMAIFDDVGPKNKLKIINQYMEKRRFVSYKNLPKLKFGKISFPKITSKEPLKIECEHFIECVKKRIEPISSGDDGLRVVKVLDAAQKSLRAGRRIKID